MGMKGTETAMMRSDGAEIVPSVKSYGAEGVKSDVVRNMQCLCHRKLEAWSA
jgi:hypothetical protein